MEKSVGNSASIKHKPTLTTKYAGFQDFMMKHQIRKGETVDKEITNTRIGSKEDNIYGGSYHIPIDEYELFLNLYSKDILSTNKKEYLTEKQLVDNGPILVDIDLRHDYEIDERQYTRGHIDDMIDIYLDKFKEIFQFDENSKFNIYILQKPTVNRVKEKNCTKDGIHMIIGLKTDRTTQKILRDKVIPLVGEAWGDLPVINSYEDVFDKGITDGTVNWQLYGSRKPNHERYKLTYVYQVTYDSTDDEIMRNELSLSAFESYNNIHELSVRYEKHPSLFLKSSFLKQREEYERKNNLKTASHAIHKSVPVLRELPMMEDLNLSNIKTKEELDMILESFLESTLASQLDYDLKDSYDYVMILPPSYYETGSYTKWIKVGWCLKNISPRLLIVWLAFSAKASTFNYSSIPDLCTMWRNFEWRPNDGITKRSLYHWAKTDAPEEYERIKQNSLNYHVEQSLKIGGKKDDKSGCGDFDLAWVLYQMCKHSYVCTSVKNNMWMVYKNHKWHDLDSGTTLRKTISNQLRELYRHQAVRHMHTNENPRNNRTDDQEPIAEQDEVTRVIQQRAINITQKLAQTSDKDHIMKEAKELFYDGEFLDKLDTNPHLLCCKNGVFDFKEKIFRNGVPEDNISMSTNIDYIPLDETKHKDKINAINTFMDQLFPEKPLCNYMWDHLASTLMGTSSNQTFNMYIGDGQNGKSVLVNLMEIVLGDYKGDVPLTLVTDRRGKVGGLAPEIVQLKGKRFAVMQEPSKGDRVNEGIMKQLTSGKDPIQARAPYMPQTISFYPQFKLVVTCNVFMEIKSNDHGTWRRIRAVPFKSLFTENPGEGNREKPYQFLIDKNIDEKFDSWKEIFLAMLVKRACETDGMVNDCDIVLQKSNEYRKSQDYLSEFVEECVLRSNSQACIQKSELNNEFIRWYEINYGGKGPSPKELHEYMDRCFGKNRASKWYGVEIKYDTNNEDDDDDKIIENSLDDNHNGL